MTPVLVAVVKNTSIVAGSEVVMTIEEMELSLKELNEKIVKFAPDEKLSNQEWRQKRLLVREKELLDNIIKARENGSSRNEAKYLTQYMLMKDDRKMNPVIRYIMQLKMRSSLWM